MPIKNCVVFRSWPMKRRWAVDLDGDPGAGLKVDDGVRPTNGPMDQWTNGQMDQWTNGNGKTRHKQGSNEGRAAGVSPRSDQPFGHTPRPDSAANPNPNPSLDPNPNPNPNPNPTRTLTLSLTAGRGGANPPSSRNQRNQPHHMHACGRPSHRPAHNRRPFRERAPKSVGP